MSVNFFHLPSINFLYWYNINRWPIFCLNLFSLFCCSRHQSLSMISRASSWHLHYIHTFKWVESAISATPVADRCIKLSTHPCNLHRQKLAVEWPYCRAQWLSTWHCHRMPPFQKVSLSNFCPTSAAPVKCTCCYCAVETSWSNNVSAAKWYTTQAHRGGQPSAEAGNA